MVATRKAYYCCYTFREVDHESVPGSNARTELTHAVMRAKLAGKCELRNAMTDAKIATVYSGRK